MPGGRRVPFLHVTTLTERCVDACVIVTCVTAAYLLLEYHALPDLLAVHFAWNGTPNGWQYKTLLRVLMPVIVQATLLLTMGGIGTLLVWRKNAAHMGREPDVVAAATAAEAVMAMAAIWVAFQGYAAISLVQVWKGGGTTLGSFYTVLEGIGIVLTAIVGIRAHRRLGRPAQPVYIPAHWRLGQLYCNAEDPALFVPTRDGRRWTLNFGRPAAAILLGGVLIVGIALPVLVLMIGLRSS